MEIPHHLNFKNPPKDGGQEVANSGPEILTYVWDVLIPLPIIRSYASVKGALYAPLAQSVEHAAVNRSVVGSSPTRGAIANMATTANMDF